LDFSASFTITLISSIIASGVQLTVFVVLYKTMKAVHIQNTNHERSFKIQQVNQKIALTFRFADWAAAEVKYYSPLFESNKDRKYILSESERDLHLVSIAKKMVKMCNDEIVDVDLLKDEVERLVLTLDNMKSKPLDVLVNLKRLL